MRISDWSSDVCSSDLDRGAETADTAGDGSDALVQRGSPVTSLLAALGGVLVLSRGGRGGRVGVAPHAGDQVLLEVLPHFHVALGELVHHRPGGLPEHAAHLLAELDRTSTRLNSSH